MKSDVLKKYSSTPKGQMSNALEQMSRAAQKAVKSGGKGAPRAIPTSAPMGGSANGNQGNASITPYRPGKYISLNGQLKELQNDISTAPVGAYKPMELKSEVPSYLKAQEESRNSRTTWKPEPVKKNEIYDPSKIHMESNERMVGFLNGRIQSEFGTTPELLEQEKERVLETRTDAAGNSLTDEELWDYLTDINQTLNEMDDFSFEYMPEWGEDASIKKSNRLIKQMIDVYGEDLPQGINAFYDNLAKDFGQLGKNLENPYVDQDDIFWQQEAPDFMQPEDQEKGLWNNELYRENDLDRVQRLLTDLEKAIENGESAAEILVNYQNEMAMYDGVYAWVTDYLENGDTKNLNGVLSYGKAKEAYVDQNEEILSGLTEEQRASYDVWAKLTAVEEMVVDYININGENAFFNTELMNRIAGARREIISDTEDLGNKILYQLANGVLGIGDSLESVFRSMYSGALAQSRDFNNLFGSDEIVRLDKAETLVKEAAEAFQIDTSSIDLRRLYTGKELMNEIMEVWLGEVLTESLISDTARPYLDDIFKSTKLDKNMGDGAMAAGRMLPGMVIGNIPVVGPALQMLYSGLDAKQQNQKSAYLESNDLDSSMDYGTLTGLLDMAMNAPGVALKLKNIDTSDMAKNILMKLGGDPAASEIMSWILKGGKEGLKNEFVVWMTNFFKQWTYDEDAELTDGELEKAFVSGLSSGFFSQMRGDLMKHAKEIFSYQQPQDMIPSIYEGQDEWRTQIPDDYEQDDGLSMVGPLRAEDDIAAITQNLIEGEGGDNNEKAYLVAPLDIDGIRKGSIYVSEDKRRALGDTKNDMSRTSVKSLLHSLKGGQVVYHSEPVVVLQHEWRGKIYETKVIADPAVEGNYFVYDFRRVD